jgi:hypothetical protein
VLFTPLDDIIYKEACGMNTEGMNTEGVNTEGTTGVAAGCRWAGPRVKEGGEEGGGGDPKGKGNLIIVDNDYELPPHYHRPAGGDGSATREKDTHAALINAVRALAAPAELEEPVTVVRLEGYSRTETIDLFKRARAFVDLRLPGVELANFEAAM